MTRSFPSSQKNNLRFIPWYSHLEDFRKREEVKDLGCLFLFTAPYSLFHRFPAIHVPVLEVTKLGGEEKQTAISSSLSY
jgi:hypothetical protein